ncbi:cholinesterase [Coprinopsis cinerea okayama7|uniref:Carboxylic ester hydrolase n=1 Tax=Coprinopsis cinerea (strain Okayama-7 / 130 / ATCC MYA-4618 / FGSC 9003) TaxID=240176 RepID=A8P0K3_COPC7|nr:cholinesterase [Coprinopsis cinerea okayama7\|eukprot:XP_001837912.2 cholinesterase [Coprinopsis cinerea okayama7\
MFPFLAIAATALLLSPTRLALGAPSASDLQADLTFLFQNDLDWPTTSLHTGAILLNRELTHRSAVEACSKLNETLLVPAGPYFQSDIKLLLGYHLSKQSRSVHRQRFWVGPGTGSLNGCVTVASDGKMAKTSCQGKFQVLCSQSAPYRRNSETDLSPAYHVQVESKGLTFTGTRDKLSFRFLGIPYADPFERFAYSTPYGTSNKAAPKTISALNYGSPCLQHSGRTGNEDCLFLNIYTPFLPRNGTHSKRDLRPVMFFIHGGGFEGGDASGSGYDGGNTVSRGDVVFVTAHYRLGTLGFLALNDGITNGNFGIADQVTALQWVRTHIAAFGGDPDRVTILGNSAGAGSVRALLASPPASGLFHAAVAQSNLGGFGYAGAFSKYYTVEEEWEMFGKGAVEAVGCDKSDMGMLECLRKADASALLNVPNVPRYIVVDGKYIVTDELKLDGSGPTADAHIMFGWTRDDGLNFIGPWPTEDTTAVEILTRSGLDQEIAQRALDSGLFPLPTGTNSSWNLVNQTSRISTDGQFLCIDQATLIAAAKNRVFRSVYGYQFDRTYRGWEPLPGTCSPPPTEGYPNGNPNLPCHDGELLYTLGNLGQDSHPFRDGDDLVMTQLSVDLWTSFARTFDPNPSEEYLRARGYTNTTEVLRKRGRWERVTPSNRRPLKLIDMTFRQSPWLEREQCEVLGYPLSYFD